MAGIAKPAFQLPTFDVVYPEEAIKGTKRKARLADFAADSIELKVVTNSLVLLTTTDSHTAACNKVADCLADAVGLGISFDSLWL